MSNINKVVAIIILNYQVSLKQARRLSLHFITKDSGPKAEVYWDLTLGTLKTIKDHTK